MKTFVESTLHTCTVGLVENSGAYLNILKMMKNVAVAVTMSYYSNVFWCATK